MKCYFCKKETSKAIRVFCNARNEQEKSGFRDVCEDCYADRKKWLYGVFEERAEGEGRREKLETPEDLALSEFIALGESYNKEIWENGLTPWQVYLYRKANYEEYLKRILPALQKSIREKILAAYPDCKCRVIIGDKHDQNTPTN